MINLIQLHSFLIFFIYPKSVQKKHDRGMIKMESDRIKYLQNYKRNQELLLSKPSQVEILGELLAMSKHVNLFLLIIMRTVREYHVDQV